MIEDRLLDGHVEGAGRLVGDEQLRVARQRDRDQGPLLHPARKLVRELVEDAPDVGQAGRAELLQRELAGHGPAELPVVQQDRLDQLAPHPLHRVQRVTRVLWHEAHEGPPNLGELPVAPFGDVRFAVADPPLEDLGVLGEDPERRPDHRRLAGPGLAHHGHQLARPDLDAHSPHSGLAELALQPVGDVQVVDREQRDRGVCSQVCFGMRHSGHRPFPIARLMRLVERTTTAITAPGMRAR